MEGDKAAEVTIPIPELCKHGISKNSCPDCRLPRRVQIVYNPNPTWDLYDIARREWTFTAYRNGWWFAHSHYLWILRVKIFWKERVVEPYKFKKSFRGMARQEKIKKKIAEFNNGPVG